MNPILMFFRERRSGREPPQRWVFKVAGRKLSLDWYSASALADAPEFSEGSFREIEDYRRFHEEIRAALSRGEGGLLATTRPEGTGVTIEVEWVPSPIADAYAPPETAFCVDPEDGLIEYPLTEPKTDLALRAGSLLILPVDAEAETRFRSFRTEYLAWFPPDFQSMMLGVLRKPSLDLLDSRVARLEEILLGIAEGRSRESRRLAAWFERLTGQGKVLTISLAAMGILAAALLGYILGLKSNPVPPPAVNRSSAESETNPRAETHGENPANPMGEAPTRNPPMEEVRKRSPEATENP